jgi:hypothetical protein
MHPTQTDEAWFAHLAAVLRPITSEAEAQTALLLRDKHTQTPASALVPAAGGGDSPATSRASSPAPPE